MVTTSQSFMLLLLAPAALAAATSDAVNERIPVRRDQLEAHWELDCSASWRRLEALAEDTPDCRAAAELRTEVQLCAFIHQPPGEQAGTNCPDYRGALDVLDNSSGEGRCRQLTPILTAGEACRGPLP